MNPAELLLIQDYVKKATLGYDSSHDFYHLERVSQNARLIWTQMSDQVAKLGLDSDEFNTKTVVLVAAWTHDVLDHKYVTNPDEYQAKEQTLDYFLVDELKLTQAEFQAVKKIIANVSFSKEKAGQLEDLGDLALLRDMVSDADKLDAIGKIGLKRCLAYTQRTHPKANQDELTALVRQHCQEKLVRLKDEYLRTKGAKEIAKPLHEVIVRFLDDEIKLFD